MDHGGIEGLERQRLPGSGIEIDALVGGAGPPLLLLHGYPQTRRCWAGAAAELQRQFTLVVPDLRGYGRSGTPGGGPDHAAYTKRAMALDRVETMRALGFTRFRVAGHDRGGRVTQRLALDHPGMVEALAILDIIPADDVYADLDAQSATHLWHWAFLVQPELPERLIGADPEYFLRWSLNALAAPGVEFDPESLADSIACLRDPSVAHGICEDYRAGFFIDRGMDAADRGLRRIHAPLLVPWGERGAVAMSAPLAKWRAWADDVRGHALPCGHFLPDEQPQAVAAALTDFFGSTPGDPVPAPGDAAASGT